ncbi:MAG: M48 family metallopeptidase, partial [Lachnospiraceae bacterium]|nr:M48 family metallopeptidase [Lachnospiraceae bacterium]
LFLGANLPIHYHDKALMQLDPGPGMAAEDFQQAALGFPSGLPDVDSAALLLPAPRLRGKGISLAAPDPELIKAQNRRLILHWYKTQAERLLKVRSRYFAQRMGLSISRIRISSARSSWGSCNAQQGINYSCFLICLSPREIDYVVVHELSHIRHRDHSKAFYAEIEKTLPDYREREAALKKDQWVLEILKE